MPVASRRRRITTTIQAGSIRLSMPMARRPPSLMMLRTAPKPLRIARGTSRSISTTIVVTLSRRAPDGTVTTTDYHRWSDNKLSGLKETETVTGLFTDETNPTGPLSARTLTTHYSYEDDDPATPPTNDGLLRKLVDPKGSTTTFTYDER